MADNDNDDVMYGNGSYCNRSIRGEFAPLLIVFSSSGAVCTVLSVVAIFFMILFGLFKVLTHRLILNMLIGILFFSLSMTIQCLGLWLDYWHGNNMIVCIIDAFLVEWSLWVMLLSTSMMTLHLTSMVLFPTHYETLTKLDLFYFLFPWISPLFIAWIPFIHHDYGLSGPWCWIRIYNDDCTLNKGAVAEMYGVLFGDVFVGLIINNVCLVTIAITLCKRACIKNEMSLEYRKALKQTLPLVVYPITYQFMTSFAIADRIYQSTHQGRSRIGMYYARAATSPSWGLFGPILTLIYLVTLRKVIKENIKKRTYCCFKKKRQNVSINAAPKDTDRLLDPSDHLTRYDDTVSNPTAYDFGAESEVDEEYYKSVFV